MPNPQISLCDLGIISSVDIAQAAATERDDYCSDCECDDCIGCVG